MASEYQHIPVPPGSMVSISDHDGNYIAGGPLLEEFTLGFNSEFGQLVDSGNNDAFTVLGAALKSLSGGQFGFSSQFKQMGFAVWKGTEPIKFNFSLEFHYTYNAYSEVVAPINRLCRLPLPGTGPLGNLIPPGPSVLEAISGTSASNVPPSGEAPTPPEIDIEKTTASADTFVNIRIGGMLFMGCLITSAEPTFSRRVDEGNSPIYGRVAVQAQTMYTGTKDDTDRAMGM